LTWWKRRKSRWKRGGEKSEAQRGKTEIIEKLRPARSEKMKLVEERMRATEKRGEEKSSPKKEETGRLRQRRMQDSDDALQKKRKGQSLRVTTRTEDVGKEEEKGLYGGRASGLRAENPKARKRGALWCEIEKGEEKKTRTVSGGGESLLGGGKQGNETIDLWIVSGWFVAVKRVRLKKGLEGGPRDWDKDQPAKRSREKSLCGEDENGILSKGGRGKMPRQPDFRTGRACGVPLNCRQNGKKELRQGDGD